MLQPGRLRMLRPVVYRQLYKWLGVPDGAVERMLEVQAQASIEEVKAEHAGVYPAWRDNWLILDIERDLLLSPDGRAVRPPQQAPEGFASLVPEDVGRLP